MLRATDQTRARLTFLTVNLITDAQHTGREHALVVSFDASRRGLACARVWTCRQEQQRREREQAMTWFLADASQCDSPSGAMRITATSRPNSELSSRYVTRTR